MDEEKWVSFEDQVVIVEQIKSLCFDTKQVDPEHIDKTIAIDTRRTLPVFTSIPNIDEAHFFILFKRAASEYILDQDLRLSKKKKSDKAANKKELDVSICHLYFPFHNYITHF